MTFTHGLAGLAVLAATTAIASAPQAPADEPALMLRSTTRLVQVEVIVRGKDAKPVSGLTQNDFEIREEGQPQQIRFFNDYTRAPRPSAAPIPGMVSNRPEVTGPRRGVTVVLIDALNSEWSNRSRALLNLRKFLDGANPDDRIAIYTLGHRLSVFHDFTGDARSLRKKLDAHQGGPQIAGIDEASIEELIPESSFLAEWGRKRENEMQATNRARATFGTLEDVANHLGSTPGWKSLVWITNGVPAQVGMDMSGSTPTTQGRLVRTGEIRSFDAEFSRAARALANANVAVYPIDPRGLQGPPEFAGTGNKLGSSARPWYDTNTVLSQLAARTGGRAFVDQNDILGSLKQITNDAQHSYTLAYYPSNTRFDGKYRKLEIRVKKTGLTANHRTGYYALDEGEVRRGDPRQEIQAAAKDPLDSALIGIDAGLQKNGEAHEISARIDAAELIWPEGGAFAAKTAIGVFQYDAEGRQLESLIDNVEFACDAAKASLLSQHGLSYGRKVTVNPAAARLRLVVRSAKTGAIGSLTVPIPR